MIENLSRFFAQKYSFCFCALLISSFFLVGCRFDVQSVEFKKGERDFELKKYSEALVHYERAVRAKPRTTLALQAASRGARIAHLETNEFKKAIELYRHIVLYASNERDRLDAQKKLATVYFEKLSDYNNSIKEYSRLLQLPHSKKEGLEYDFVIAKSYFYLNNFYQAGIEMKEILPRVEDPILRFEYLSFQGNILLTTKKLKEAASIFRAIMEQYPDEAIKENIPISLAVTYEEQGDFQQAIEVLEKIKKNYPAPDFLDLRIKRLRERVLNQPGARGLTK